MIAVLFRDNGHIQTVAKPAVQRVSIKQLKLDFIFKLLLLRCESLPEFVIALVGNIADGLLLTKIPARNTQHVARLSHVLLPKSLNFK